MPQLESSWHGRSVDHVSTCSGRQIAVGSQKPSRITRQKTCCASESNTSVRVVFANRSGFDAPIGVILAWEERGSCLTIFQTINRGRISETFTNYEAKDPLRKSVDHVSTYYDDKSRSDLGNLQELRGKRLVAQVSQTRRFALYSRTGVVLMLQLESSWHGRSVDHVSTYSGRLIAVGRLRGKRVVAQVSQTRRFANQSGFDAPIGVVFAWEKRASCLNVFQTTNRGRISETFTNYEAKELLRSRLRMGGAWIMSQRIPDDKSRSDGFDASIGVIMAWEERGSCLNVFRTTNRDRISETFTNYEAKDLLRKRQIVVGSRIPSRITRQKIGCASESNTLVRVVFTNRSSFDAPIGVVFAWEERGSCLNVFRTTNRGRMVLMPQLESSWHGRSVDHVSTYSGRQIAIGSRKPSRITRQKIGCASELNMSVRVVFANRSGFDALIGFVLAWEERDSCLNIFYTTNRAQISETFTNYKAKDSLRRSVDHVSTYSGRQIPVGSRKPSRITRQKTCCARAWIMSQRIPDDKSRSDGFDAPIGVVLACESNTWVRVVFVNRSGFDALIGVVLAWEERGSCLNVFRTTNRSRMVLMPQLESSWHGRSVDHVSTYSGRQIAVGFWKPSRITRQKTCCASESNTSVRVVFANRSGFDAPIGVVLAWEERGTCLNVFWTTNRRHISETITNYEAKDLLRKSVKHVGSRTGVVLMPQLESSWYGRSVHHVSTYPGQQITVRSRKPSRITRKKTCCARAWIMSRSIPDDKSRLDLRNLHELRGKILVAQVSETRRFANRSGFDAPIGVVFAWEERGSCLNVFRTTNRGRISETFTNYEAKELLSKSVDHVSMNYGRQIAVGSWKPSRITRQKTCCASESNTLYSRTGLVLMPQLESSWHGRSVDHVSTYPGRKIGVGSLKPSRITRKKTCCASESNTSVRVVFANRSGFDAPIGVVLEREERGSCLNVFRTTNLGRISETFTNYEAKDLLRK
ncbi:uncharacterized protein G2W53_010373 [Senna tora]|uniref:Uncharacterized protein n=1 Tax=Senna tora TaxID=362788 RepID=A0A835C9L4_9FABA|nr:uncharacterized protein G2W53_010373 [Senna tora]